MGRLVQPRDARHDPVRRNLCLRKPEDEVDDDGDYNTVLGREEWEIVGAY